MRQARLRGLERTKEVMNLKKHWVVLCLLAGAVLALGMNREWMVVGRGVMHGHPGHLQLAFDMEVRKSEGKTRGSLLLWGEGGHPYPDIILRADHVAEAKFLGSTAKLLALGRYHNVPVVIVVTASDNNEFKRPDTLGVLVLDLLGRPMIYTFGEVEQGNIYVGPAD